MTDGELNPSGAHPARCARCGRRCSAAPSCSHCGAPLPFPPRIAQAPSTGAIRPASRRFELQPVPLRLPALSSARSPRGSSVAGTEVFGTGQPEVAGRVLFVRQGPSEPQDFDPWRWIAIPVWAMLALITPLVLAVATWQAAGPLPALLLAFLALLVLRYFFSDRLFHAWRVVAALNGRNIVEPMPVLAVRLRLEDERETQLRLKGHLDGGHLLEGDRIRATGRWRQGVLVVREVVCERTGATIRPRQPNASGFALAGSGLLLTCCLWLFGDGIPWARTQLHDFRIPSGPLTFPDHLILSRH